MRWTSRRKGVLSLKSKKRLITPEEAKRRYELVGRRVGRLVRDYAAYGQDGLGVKQRRPRKRITKADRDHLSDRAIPPTSGRADHVQIRAVKNRQAEEVVVAHYRDTRGGPMIDEWRSYYEAQPCRDRADLLRQLWPRASDM